MDLRLIRVFLILWVFFSENSAGEFARGSKGVVSLPSDPSFHLHISKFDNKIQNDRPTALQLTEDPEIHRGEPTLYTAHRVIYPQTEPESVDTMSQREVVTPMMTVPTINPSTPTTTTPIYNPLPTPANPTPTTNPYTTPTYPDTTPTNPATNPYSTPTYPDTTPTNPATNPYSTPATGNPTTPTPAMGNPTTPTPAMGNPTSGGQSWCVASPSASETALQVALDYACGYGGADCSAIQQGGSCFNPDTVRDHASYAFNSYYQKNPTPTSCDFSGTAIVTNTDPSTTTCHYPSSSTSASTLNTTNPTGGGSTIFGSSPPTFGSSPPTFGSSPPTFGSSPPTFGSSPPDYTDTNSSPTKASSSFTLICFLATLIYLKVYK